MPTNFGSRVIGKDAFDKAVREEKGGAAVFGVRVRGAITEGGPISIAKRNTEHGVRVVEGAKAQDEKGKDNESVSIESLRNILAENPTFFDSLYEAELARTEGARPEALEIFQIVESGIKGAGRREILDEIATLLGVKKQLAAATADDNIARREQLARQAKRMEDNAALVDADKIQALADRQENLDSLEGTESGKQVISSSTESQIAGIKEEKGLDTGETAHQPTTPAKPDGPINVETQAPGPRITTPKAVSGDTPTGASTTDASETGEGEKDFDSMTVEELHTHLGEDAEVKGTGAGGRVLKADLVKAAKKAAKSKEK